ncbi:MAG: cell envelope integrity protein CreD [Zoogloeaceae bacterium]|jgi:inner membrane protein|nr:cell envelope integrity protein CreD [Zoogloeaceae bacterium]
MDKKLLTKLLGIVVLTASLLLPLRLIEEQIVNRGRFQKQVTTEIAQSVASAQTLTGPVLAIRYRVKTLAGATRERIFPLAAERLDITGKASVEQRYRGIYRARLYHMEMTLDGDFNLPADLLPLPRENEQIEASVVLLMGISDLDGLSSDPEVNINNRPFRFKAPEDKTFDAILPGNRLEMKLGQLTPGQAQRLKFDFPLRLTGTETFSIAPTAGSNHIQLQSAWRHPSFQGRLPDEREEISAKGFTANWKISRLNRPLERILQAHSAGTRGRDVVSVNFMDPVNIYLQSERAVKYGILFIALTFAAFFLGETLRRHPMHLMQYLLAGLALAVFFLLLVALSEHIDFLYAYLVAAVGCIGLIVFYLSGALGGWLPAFAFGAGLSSLYGILYGLLQSEDNALLMGSLLIFAALAAIMISTRKLDWNRLNHAPA